LLREAVMKLNPLLSLLSLAALACEQGQQSPLSLPSQTRDSAGIRIVENVRPPDGSRLPWRIGPEPAVSIGAVEGDEPYMLDGAIDATRLRDGRIVVANVGTQELRVFDAAGIYLTTWGGEGEGPGEFTGLSQVEPWPGDSIVAWSAPRFGISVFDARGTYARTFRLVHDEATSPMQRFWPQSTTRDGAILAAHRPEAADTVVVQLRDGEGEIRSSFGTHPGSEPYIHYEGDRSMLFWKIFGRQPVWAPWGDLTVVATTDHYELRAFRTDGSLSRIVRRDHVPRSPTEADREPFVEEQLSSFEGADIPELIVQAARKEFETVPMADFFPAFSSVRGDATGHLWVEEYESPREDRPGTLWTVFDPDGHALGFVETPDGLEIYEIGEDYILGRVKDGLGVERIQLWPLDRSG